MGGPRRRGVVGPLEEHAAGYAAELVRQGYAAAVVANHVELMGWLSSWLETGGVGAGDLTSVVIDRFVSERLVAGRSAWSTSKALAPLLAHLRAVGAVPPPTVDLTVGPVEEVLDRFGRYLLAERGLTVGTVRGYVDKVRPFLAGRAHGATLDLAGLTAADVTGFVVAVCPGRAPGPAKLTVSALRSLLRFLHVTAVLPGPLDGAVPSVASWRLSGLPRPLAAAEVAAMLASCDRRSGVGRRDYAMLVVLSRLGLRSGEVARLGLDDIDWRAGEITVSGKGARFERLPLPADVGAAIAGYLRRGRPPTAQGRTVFVRVVAPHRGLTAGGVTQAVAAAGRRAGLGVVFAHRLRHSAATAMLAAGVPLPEIGQVLRHRRLLTTAIYAKVDVDALRTIVRPWPAAAR